MLQNHTGLLLAKETDKVTKKAKAASPRPSVEKGSEQGLLRPQWRCQLKESRLERQDAEGAGGAVQEDGEAWSIVDLNLASSTEEAVLLIHRPGPTRLFSYRSKARLNKSSNGATSTKWTMRTGSTISSRP